MDRTGSSGCPLIGLVVFIHPKQDVHIPLFRLENDATVILIYPNGPQVVVLGALDLLVVVCGSGGIGGKLVKEASHFLLLLLGKATECRQEVSPESQFDVEEGGAHFFGVESREMIDAASWAVRPEEPNVTTRQPDFSKTC